MYLCPRCNKRRHVIESIKTDSKTKKKYIVTVCSICKYGIDCEELKGKK